MNAAISVASVLACACSLDAQITATLNRAPGGLDEVRIRNDSSATLAAFVVTAARVPGNSWGNAPLVVFSDPIVDPAARPLPAGEEQVVLKVGAGFSMPARTPGVRPGDRLLEGPVATAGIFADGATNGDGALLARLIMRRSNMLLAVEISLETLLDAGRRNIPRHELIEQFKKMAGSLNRWYLPPEQQIGRGLYQSMVGKLMNLPEGPAGSPFPPSSFVAQETAALNRQRVTLLESQPSLADALVIGAR